MPQPITRPNPEPVRVLPPRLAKKAPRRAERPAPPNPTENADAAEDIACAAHWAY